MFLNAFGTIKFSALWIIKYIFTQPNIYAKNIPLSFFDKLVSIIAVNIPAPNVARASSATILFCIGVYRISDRVSLYLKHNNLCWKHHYVQGNIVYIKITPHFYCDFFYQWSAWPCAG